MQYLLLIYRDEALELDPETPEFAEQLATYRGLLQEMKEAGHLISAEPLKPVATATTVRRREGKIQLIDGPFAETKEQLAGYFLLECPDLDCALAYAKRIPVLRIGCVEVRPIQDFTQSHPA